MRPLLLFALLFWAPPLGSAARDPYVMTSKDTVERQTMVNRRLSDQARWRLSSVLASAKPLDEFWQAWKKRHESKTEASLWSQDHTLVSFKYVVLPIWWEDESPKTPYDSSNLEEALAKTVEYYSDMSWNKHNLQFEVLDQITLSGITISNGDFGNTEVAVRDHVQNTLGLTEFVDYSGIMVVFDTAEEGPFVQCCGGWANTNGDFIWMFSPSWFDVVRHEVMHNYGHPHHLANTYKWRIDRGLNEESADYDGWDMMSGGNGFSVSDIHPASKLHFNWITDDAIVSMQPDGASANCPDCQSSVSGQILRPFDDPAVLPSVSNKMAIHIPVMGDGNTAYSYWLSYRSGNDGEASIGLSIHVTSLKFGGIFGALFDSLNYDVFGDTPTTVDSFVLPGTCYLVSPPSMLMDLDPSGPEQVQPKVCVDSLDKGKSITVSVSFMDPASPPVTKSSTLTRELDCSTDGTSFGPTTLPVLPPGAVHLLHYTGTGFGGEINLSLCLESGSPGTVIAYFYDSYPNGYLAYSAPPGYGAFKSLTVAEICDSLSTTSYLSEYGETYVLIVDNSGIPNQMSVRMNSVCTVRTCHGSQYLSEKICLNCPAGHVSDVGSTDISDCVPCAQDGFVAIHPKSTNCALPDQVFDGPTTGRHWRILSTGSQTKSGWRWDVDEIYMYSSDSCAESSRISTDFVSVFDSGNAGDPYYGPSNAFSGNSEIWGGRPDERDLFFLGVTFDVDTTIECIRLVQLADFDSGATELIVQTKQTGTSTDWENVWIAKNLQPGENLIPFLVVPTTAPSPSLPTDTPTTAPPEVGCQYCDGGGIFFKRSRLYRRNGSGECVERCILWWLKLIMRVFFGWTCTACN